MVTRPGSAPSVRISPSMTVLRCTDMPNQSTSGLRMSAVAGFVLPKQSSWFAVAVICCNIGHLWSRLDTWIPSQVPGRLRNALLQVYLGCFIVCFTGFPETSGAGFEQVFSKTMQHIHPYSERRHSQALCCHACLTSQTTLVLIHVSQVLLLQESERRTGSVTGSSAKLFLSGSGHLDKPAQCQHALLSAILKEGSHLK